MDTDTNVTKTGKTYTYVCPCGKTVSQMASGRHFNKCQVAQDAARDAGHLR